LPFRPTAGAFADGEPAERVERALAAAGWSGLTMADLLHQTRLGWDDLFPIVDAGLEARRYGARQLPARQSQGERIAGSMRYVLR
jgi:hypothetical protein